MEETGRCLNPQCDAEPWARGLCNACYSAARRQVALGRVTWEALEQAGMALKPGRPRPGKRIAWVLSANEPDQEVS